MPPQLTDVWTEFARSLRLGLIHLLYPAYCVLCLRNLPPGDAILCDDCRAAVLTDPLPSCPRCATTVGPFVELEDGCVYCRKLRLPFDATIRLGHYDDGPLRDLVLRIKYRHEWLAEAVGRLWVTHAADRFRAFQADLVVPVPLHWFRRLTRGYNQSESLAREIANFLHIPCIPSVLRRVRATSQQRRLKSHDAKRENVRDAFRVVGGEVLRGRTVLLVDDVMTSGSTASEAANTLQSAGAGRVVLAVLARAS